MERANIDRINELSRIARERELTEEEKAERQELRAAYLRAFRSQFKRQLDNTVVEYPDGSRVPFRDVHGKKKP